MELQSHFKQNFNYRAFTDFKLQNFDKMKYCYVITYLNRPIRLKCENISPPGTNSITIYKFELS